MNNLETILYEQVYFEIYRFINIIIINNLGYRGYENIHK